MDYCFYLDWKGLTPSEWAAWVQAVFSVLAIIAAGMFPIIHERLTRKRAVNSFVAIFAEILDKGARDLALVRFVTEKSQGIDPNQMHDWRGVRRLLASMPVHSLPDHRLFPLLQEADDAIEEILRLFANHGGTFERFLPDLVATQQQRLEWCYEQACKLSDSLGFGFKAWRSKVDPITDRVKYTVRGVHAQD